MITVLRNSEVWSRFFISGRTDKRSFKRLTSYLSVYGLHGLYEYVVRRYDGDLEFSTASGGYKKKFVGKGYGANTLNSYRKLTIDGRSYFEKIYFKDSLDFKKCLFFYENIKDELLQNDLRVPILYKVEEGKKLAVMYFEYLKLEKNESSRVSDFQRSLEITSKLGELELPQEYRSKDFLLEFSTDPMFQERLDIISRSIEEEGSDNRHLMETTMDELENVKRQLQHGDLFSANFTENYVIDWDRVGFYPFGYDLGLVLSFHGLSTTETEIEPELIVDEIKALGVRERGEILSVYFFTIIFLCNRNERSNYYNFNKLTAYLKKLL